MKNNFYFRYKTVLIPSVVMVVTLIGSLIAGKTLWDKLNITKAEVASSQTEIQILQDRLAVLQSSSSNVPAYSKKVLVALPSENSALNTVSQLRKFAGDNNMLIDKFSMEGGMQPNFTFEIEGDLSQVVGFLSDLGKTMPLVNINSVYLENDDVVSARLSVSSFWAPLPETLPSITDPIESLTEEELAVLTTISSFQYPTTAFPGVNLYNNENTGRSNPFSFF